MTLRGDVVMVDNDNDFTVIEPLRRMERRRPLNKKKMELYELDRVIMGEDCEW